VTCFDEEPEDPHHECGLEIHGLKKELSDLRAKVFNWAIIMAYLERNFVENKSPCSDTPHADEMNEEAKK
jgi:hypothetical protein